MSIVSIWPISSKVLTNLRRTRQTTVRAGTMVVAKKPPAPT